MAYISRNWRRRVWLAPLVFQVIIAEVGWSESAVGGAEIAWQERFLREAPQKWLEYRRIVTQHTEGRTKSTTTLFYEEKTEKDSYEKKAEKYETDLCFAIRVRGKEIEGWVCYFKNGKPDSREIFNTQYRAELVAGRGGRWVLRQFESGGLSVPEDLLSQPKDPRFATEVYFGSRALDWAIGIPCSGQILPCCGWLARLIESPYFQLQKVSPVGKEGLVKVEFRFEPKEDIYCDVRGGTILLDSKRYWLIREVSTDIVLKFSWDEKGLIPVRGLCIYKAEISQANMPVPYISRSVLTQSCEKGYREKPWKTITESVRELRWAPEMDPKQFRLSGYGLPEPPAKK